MKLLIVDDSLEMRQMVKLMVGDLVTETRECADGDEALAAYLEFRPDWVVMDWEMKRMNGLPATRRILAADPAARICLIAQDPEDEMRVAAEQAGARAYIVTGDLLELRRVLNATPGRRKLAEPA